ncbi:MAG: hypothetical protein M1819_000203 [Sarea resinae]|nr:MAG: hypothetical protein M1819_000203 [Sarea resinae]
MDGTIIDSTNAIIKHWHKLGAELGVDPNVILATSHGRRSIDVLKLYDPKRATREYVAHVESLIPREFGQDATLIPGARDMLSALESAHAPRAIVTSGTRPLVTGWLEVLKLAHPENLVTAEDVENGKPDPACYALGRSKLGLSQDAPILVFEDAPAGIRAGKAARCKVVGLATTHSIEQLKDAGADWIVRDMRSVSFKGKDVKTGELLVEIRDALQD